MYMIGRCQTSKKENKFNLFHGTEGNFSPHRWTGLDPKTISTWHPSHEARLISRSMGNISQLNKCRTPYRKLVLTSCSCVFLASWSLCS